MLLEKGHGVHAPTLTGVGDRAHLVGPDTGLHTHIEDVVAVLEIDDLQDVVLVGHSAGGAVITGVAQRCAHRLRELVYLDAFVPQPSWRLEEIAACHDAMITAPAELAALLTG